MFSVNRFITQYISDSSIWQWSSKKPTINPTRLGIYYNNPGYDALLSDREPELLILLLQ